MIAIVSGGNDAFEKAFMLESSPFLSRQTHEPLPRVTPNGRAICFPIDRHRGSRTTKSSSTAAMVALTIALMIPLFILVRMASISVIRCSGIAHARLPVQRYANLKVEVLLKLAAVDERIHQDSSGMLAELRLRP